MSDGRKDDCKTVRYLQSSAPVSVGWWTETDYDRA